MKKTSRKRIRNKNGVNDEMEIGIFIKIIIIVAILFLAFYLLTIYINKKDKENNTTKAATIQYDNILLSNALNQSADNYYVLIYSSEDKGISLYQTYINLYKQTVNANRFYYVQLDNPFNSSYISEEPNLNISNISELKIKEITLLKVSNGLITESYEGIDLVKSTLKELAGVKASEE